ncbi:Predicted ATP-dependent protease [Nitrosomonas sp. Nm51]|uniref:Lon protease family protein n=1 Tax=Nitrosomonas sp. Nm51 TaxID=133720 RepID=UPI0008D60523|nr:ATP-binding protein [Nitrosomonas sp. Nm51]SER19839.1 Predicted ATP-dependent protease [Nitrosomonas sp. Nm51]
MPAILLKSTELRINIDPEALGFKDTSALLQFPLSWIGQERAKTAASFGLAMQLPDYHLFVLGEVGSGRSSLLLQAMIETAEKSAVPPDLCYLYNFTTPEKPVALRTPAGQGRLLRNSLEKLTATLFDEITLCLNGRDFKIKQDRLLKKFKTAETELYTHLDAYAEERNFSIRRETEQIVFTMRDNKGKILTEDELFKLPKTQRAKIDQTEQELHAEITRYFEAIKRVENDKKNALASLKRNNIQPILDQRFNSLRNKLHSALKKNRRLTLFLEQVIQDILDNLSLFESASIEMDPATGPEQPDTLDEILSCYQINLAVDNSGLKGAPVIVEDNPHIHSLFGNIDYQFEEGKVKTDFMHIRAGSLHKAHGGFIMLHLSDLLSDPMLWTRLRRLLRSKRLQIGESASTFAANIPVSIDPEAVDISIKIVLIGSREDYYYLQYEDPEFIRRFRVKVDFTDSFKSNPETYHASSVFVTHICQSKKLPHFSAAAVARLLEESHRAVDDQTRQSAIFARMEMLVLESAAQCKARGEKLVETADVAAALQTRAVRHNAPDQWLQEAITDGDILIALDGQKIGQLNAITLIEMGDYCFGAPVRVTARTFAGENGLSNIAHEVDMSGPIHDKGVLILHNYLSALFAHIAPLALNASIVFEQEYTGIEGDSASCAEFYALLSSLSRIPVKQSIAITGALNQYGEVLPVGGINDKIEGFFNICARSGLNGEHGVLIPHRNKRHLMLNHDVIEAVEQNLFHIYTMQHVTEGLELLTGVPSGISQKRKIKKYSAKTVLGRAEKTLIDFRFACQTFHSRPDTT